MSTPSPDARAVVAAVDRLTTQVRRLADTRQTPTDDATTTCDALYTRTGLLTTRCIRPANHKTPRHTDSGGRNWSEAVAIYPIADAPTTTADDGPRCVCGDPIELTGDPAGWIHSPGSNTPCLDARPNLARASVEASVRDQAPADDEEQQRTHRREQLRTLLARLDRGGLLSPGDCTRLRQHIAAEQHEADTLRAITADHRVETRALREKLERYGQEAKEQRERAEQAEAERDRYARSEMEEQAHAEQAQAAIERVRTECAAIERDMYGAEDDGMRVAIVRILAALDRAEQPTTKEN
ncbi:hypothetical protein [Streptomyces werraensis]|uniref:hypothetical protein n=1 Tax=Streptomyces werraensis TaxID=68284 RepID=UPI0036A3815A